MIDRAVRTSLRRGPHDAVVVCGRCAHVARCGSSPRRRPACPRRAGTAVALAGRDGMRPGVRCAAGSGSRSAHRGAARCCGRSAPEPTQRGENDGSHPAGACRARAGGAAPRREQAVSGSSARSCPAHRRGGCRPRPSPTSGRPPTWRRATTAARCGSCSATARAWGWGRARARRASSRSSPRRWPATARAWRVVNLAADGADIDDVLTRQLPELVELTADGPRTW